MKWWGWGEEGVSFSHDDKPKLAPFFKKHIGLDLNADAVSVPAFSALNVPASVLPAELKGALEAVVGAQHVKTDDHDRVVHSYGKSVRDLVRIRKDDLGRVPDAICYPESEGQVRALVDVALGANAVLIPFGGGSNISGSLEAPRDETRPVLSIDMSRMRLVLAIDEDSRTAQVQTGAFGPDLEAQLNEKGWTLGHFPDSFNYSTLGGWIATRSSGMQSDKYGDIADLTRAVRVVMPNGTLFTRNVPSQSTGPSVREMILGSEGRLGIITEATVHVHRIPAVREIQAYIFKDFDSGLAAMNEISESDANPSITRVSDSYETAFSFATSKKGKLKSRLETKALLTYLKNVKRFDVDKMCLSFIGFEGSESHVDYQKNIVLDIVKKHNGVNVGTGPGRLYDQKKFDTPYIRDYLLDRNALADVSETAAPWSKLAQTHASARDAANQAFKEIGAKGYVMCHLSHSYHSGACLYFTFAFPITADDDALKMYDVVKSAIQSSFMESGATLSHHHAVGVEHAQWLSEDISPTGAALVKTLLDGADPGHNLNPGKIVR